MSNGKDPATIALLTYAWVILISCFGGAVNFINKVRSGAVRFFNVTEFIGELVTSAFAGVITFYLCTWAELDPLLTAALVGISGHMGSRAIFRLEKWAEKKFLGEVDK